MSEGCPPSTVALYRALAAHLGETREAAPSHRFGGDALKVDGKIYATLSHGRLLLKLPATRVETLLASGQGERFHSGGRAMKEWITIGPEQGAHWPALAQEARVFIAGHA